MELNNVIISVLTTFILCDVTAEKILFLPLQQTSHTKLQQSIVAEMHSRGHQVYTVLGTRFGAKTKDKIIAPGGEILWFQQRTERQFTGGNIDELFEDLLNDFNTENHRKTWDESVKIMNEDCIDIFNNKIFLKNLRSLKIDVAVVDYWHPLPCLLLLPFNLSIPYLVNSVSVLPWLMREPGLPSFVPFILSQKSDKMAFWERIENIYEHYSIYHMQSVARNNYTQLEMYAPGTSHWNTLLEKSLLFIQIRDYILEWPQPTMPNNIRLFGLSYQKAKPLHGTLASVVSESTNDVIVVSFGSMGGKLPRKYVIKLLEAFATINKTFIFSHSEEKAKTYNIPPNVHVFPWLPQNDILGHPKTKLFITHAGHNGQSEATYHGVPMICMPLYFEQFHNAFRVKEHKFGLTVNIYDFTVTELQNAIHDVLYNPIYRQNVKHASEIVKSLPESKEIAADWIEHVIRFGDEHLRTFAFQLPWYQYFMLDILAFISVLFLLIVTAIVCLIYGILKIFRPKQKVKVQ